MAKSILIVVMLLGLLGGCVTADVRMTSNKEAGYQKRLGRVLVTVNMRESGVDGARVGQILSQQLSARGTAVETMIVRPLDLDPGRMAAEARARFRPTHVLSLDIASLKAYQRSGAVHSFSIDATIADTASTKTVWRASIDHLGSDKTGERLASAVVERLGLDGML